MVTNACRRFGSVGHDCYFVSFTKLPKGHQCLSAFWVSRTFCGRYWRNYYRCHQCLSAFWVSRTWIGGGENPLRVAPSPMPVGVLGQSDSHIAALWSNRDYLRHQCLSAFWVSRTRKRTGRINTLVKGVTNACRRFGSVGQPLYNLLISKGQIPSPGGSGIFPWHKNCFNSRFPAPNFSQLVQIQHLSIQGGTPCKMAVFHCRPGFCTIA